MNPKSLNIQALSLRKCVSTSLTLIEFFYHNNYYVFVKFTDLDECLLEQDDCDTNANCINTNGSYTCSCKDGYYGNGEICFSEYTVIYMSLMLHNDYFIVIGTRDCNEETGTSNCGCSIGYYFDPSTGQCEGRHLILHEHNSWQLEFSLK